MLTPHTRGKCQGLSRYELNKWQRISGNGAGVPDRAAAAERGLFIRSSGQNLVKSSSLFFRRSINNAILNSYIVKAK